MAIEMEMELWRYQRERGGPSLFLGLAVVVQARPAKSRWAVMAEAWWRPW